MSCAKPVLYNVKESTEPHAFTYRRVLEWEGKWVLLYRGESDAAEIAGLLPLSFIGKGDAWSMSDGPILPPRSDSYLHLAYSCIGAKHTGAFAVCPYYSIAQLWIWTVDGWCLQADRRNW